MSDYDIEHQLWLAVPREERESSSFESKQCDLCYEHVDSSECADIVDLAVCNVCVDRHYWSCSGCNEPWPNRIKPHVSSRGLTCEDCLGLDHLTK